MPAPYTLRDYHRLNFTDLVSEYYIGTNNNRKFISEETTLCPNQECFVYINDDSVKIRIIKDCVFVFRSKIYKVRVKRDTVDGFIDIWAEGNLSR